MAGMTQATDQQLLEWQQDARALWNKNSPWKSRENDPGPQKIVNAHFLFRFCVSLLELSGIKSFVKTKTKPPLALAKG